MKKKSSQKKYKYLALIPAREEQENTKQKYKNFIIYL